jgi:hypothetical protein|tara:strand:+ start:20461 stop:20613 length:153 start_codon:yes stop_codon:yes gene_type:complete
MTTLNVSLTGKMGGLMSVRGPHAGVNHPTDIAVATERVRKLGRTLEVGVL